MISPKLKDFSRQMNEDESDRSAWPRVGDVIFRSDGDGCVAWVPGRPVWALYSEGYKRAGDIVVERLQETGRSADFLIYPVVFLYRHHLELLLKEVIISGRQRLGEPEGCPIVHRFEELWPICRTVLESLWPGSPRADLDAIEVCFRQFSDVDSNSMNFRYPLTRDGKPSLPTSGTINVENLQRVVNNMSTLLECARTAITTDF